MFISRTALAVQAIFLLVPLTFLAVFGGVAILLEAPHDLRGNQPGYVALLLVSWLALGCGWALVSEFVVRGRIGLRKLRRWVVIGAISGLLPVLAGVVALSSGPFAAAPWPSIFVVGLPAVIPLVHALWEWRRAIS